MVSDGDRQHANRWIARLLVLFAVIWGAQTTGLVSSNDGSHLALARALAVRGETRIDPEMALTLRVDLAEHDGHYYSDRPPGTALLALPAALVGHQLDRPLLRASQRRGDMIVSPASERYIYTYVARVDDAPPLAGYMGTSLALAFHTVLVSLLGLWCIDALLRRRQVDTWGRAFVLASLALASAWGPYATVLFSHMSAAALLAGFVLGLDHLREEQPARWIAPVTGLLGAWAVACDFILLLVVVPAVLATVAPRRWPPILAGALPIAGAVLAYHHAAFGSPFTIGYAHHSNFEFARDTSTTFDGNPIEGLWSLLGFGHGGAGLLAQSPVLAAGTVGLFAMSKPDRRLAAAFLPWLILLSMHRTPWGGATEDHRYLIPALVVLALGLGLLWKRWLATQAWLQLAAVALALISSALIWSHFFEWRQGAPFDSPFVGLGVGGLAGLAALVISRVRAPRKSP